MKASKVTSRNKVSMTYKTLAIKSLRRFAVSHGEMQFANMCTAALKGEQWARDRLGLDWGGGLSDTNWGGASLLAIRTTDTTRPSK